MRRSNYLWSALLLLVTIVACTTSRYAAEDNLSRIYDKNTSPIKPDYTIYHHQADSSEVWFSINTENLLYIRTDKASPFVAKVRLSYKVYDNLSNKLVVDSASTMIQDSETDIKQKTLVGTVSFNLPAEGQYTMRIEATDLHRKQSDVTFLELDNRPSSRQYFKVTTSSGVPVFSAQRKQNEQLTVQHAQGNGAEVFGRYYNRKFPLPPPPFSLYNMKTFEYEADSLFIMNMDAAGKLTITLPEEGFLHLQLDSSSKEGLTLYAFNPSFPNINSHQSMLLPMRYITSKTEFKKMKESTNVQQEIERFWINHCGSKERARSVIKSFYNRVQNANVHFTSFVEGWKTDRGLIHIIYGNPNAIYKNKDSEMWVYGEETNINSITFTFFKVDNPFTDNDYILSRNANYKTNWYRALESWRQGRVFSSY